MRRGIPYSYGVMTMMLLVPALFRRVVAPLPRSLRGLARDGFATDVSRLLLARLVRGACAPAARIRPRIRTRVGRLRQPSLDLADDALSGTRAPEVHPAIAARCRDEHRRQPAAAAGAGALRRPHQLGAPSSRADLRDRALAERNDASAQPPQSGSGTRLRLDVPGDGAALFAGRRTLAEAAACRDRAAQAPDGQHGLAGGRSAGGRDSAGEGDAVFLLCPFVVPDGIGGSVPSLRAARRVAAAGSHERSRRSTAASSRLRRSTPGGGGWC